MHRRGHPGTAEALVRPSSGPKPPPHVAEFLPPRGLSSPADTRLVFSLMPHPPRRRPSAAMVVALLALFIALDGPATAARLVDGRAITKNSITSAQVRNRALGTQDLSRSAVRTLRSTPSRSIFAKQLRDGAVGTRALGAKAVEATKVADGAIGNTQLAG